MVCRSQHLIVGVSPRKPVYSQTTNMWDMQG